MIKDIIVKTLQSGGDLMKWDELPDTLKWDRKLAYFLNPANQDDISREDLQDVLAILAARYCDEFFSLRFLECFVEEELGSERLEEAIEASIDSDYITDRCMHVLNQETLSDRMSAAQRFVNEIADEYGELSDEDF